MAGLWIFGPPNVERLRARRNVKRLIKALGYTRDNRVRAAAAQALGEIGDVGAVEPLIAVLAEYDAITPVSRRESWKEIRHAAAKALVQMGTPAVETLAKHLDHPAQTARHAVAVALGETGDRRAIEPLIAALADPHESISAAAAGILGRIGDGRAVEPLGAALADPRMWVRVAAVDALKRIGDARAVEPLIAALADPYSRVGATAAGILGRIGGGRAVEPLIAALADPRTTVCAAAARALGEIGHVGAVGSLLDVMRQDGPIDVRLDCYAALASIQNEALTEADTEELARAAAAEIRSLYGRTKAVEQEAQVGSETVVHVTREWVELPVGSPGHYGWEEVEHEEQVPTYGTIIETVSDPDYSHIDQIIQSLPKELYTRVRALSGEARHCFQP